ncbi:MAG: FkbM family methyltransferase [Sphingobacteriia bacterium]|nr:FkbM family methyltransferase [Sphingobacteriia bacterium]
MKLIKRIYVFFFTRNLFFPINKFLFKHSLYGMGILNFENDKVSGESFFIDLFLKNQPNKVIFDVGANVGNYSATLRQKGYLGQIFAFEPHPTTFIQLTKLAEQFNFNAINSGLGKCKEKVFIYDYANNKGSQHASLYKDVITEIHHSSYQQTEIELTTVDDFILENKINKIDLLKIDTEGNELSVLQGAQQAIEKGMIQFIQIEFNEMNIVSKTFMKDIFKILPGYKFYRLLPTGLLPLKDLQPVLLEIFAFQNIIAIKNN